MQNEVVVVVVVWYMLEMHEECAKSLARRCMVKRLSAIFLAHFITSCAHSCDTAIDTHTHTCIHTNRRKAKSTNRESEYSDNIISDGTDRQRTRARLLNDTK